MSGWVDVTSASNKSAFNNVKSFEDKNNLGKDDFLRILTTQLSNQDPSKPLEDKEFIAQMATFSTLEQMTNLNQTFEKFANSQSNQMSQYVNAIGKEISWTPNGSSSPSSGQVDGVSSQSGEYYYLVGEEKIPVNEVTEIMQKQDEIPTDEKTEINQEENETKQMNDEN